MSIKHNIEKSQTNNKIATYYGQKKLLKFRAEVNQLYFTKGLSKNMITAKKHISKHFVIRWTQSPDQDFSIDNRGWPRGKRRKWDQHTEHRIVELHAYLKANPKAFFWGASAIEQEWRHRYPNETIPPLRTIGQILKDLGLSDKYRKHRNTGASRYLCYPEHTIYHSLGKRVMEADFVGQKYLTGRTEPIHFIGFSFKTEPKFRYFKRIEAKNAKAFICGCKEVFEQYERPECIKVDNATEPIGSRSGKRNISKVMAFLLGNQIWPIYAVPRRPFSQASIEGNNSVFARNFWNRRTFSCLSDIDCQLAWFNEASLRYTGYEVPRSGRQKKREFVPKVYFLRQVRELSDGGDGWIEVLNEIITLPASYISYFVLAEWHLLKERLTVHIEKDKQLESIISVPFKINPESLKKIQKGGALSFCI
jgi:transposase